MSRPWGRGPGEPSVAGFSGGPLRSAQVPFGCGRGAGKELDLTPDQADPTHLPVQVEISNHALGPSDLLARLVEASEHRVAHAEEVEDVRLCGAAPRGAAPPPPPPRA